ncbi:MAG: phosphoenolpyruvate-protein phosphotransferase [Planctomycetota bacterium]|jgi:phosphoenolpyruvate-protein phosphotransferase
MATEPGTQETGDQNADGTGTQSEAGNQPVTSLVLRGDSVSPGMVLGTVHRKDYDLSRSRAQRVALDEVDRELNRFRTGLEDSRLQLVDLKSRLEGRVNPDDARILDTHVTYLKDSVFIADVENLILNEQMSLEAAITKVISDFNRIFKLVQNETLRQSAVDLRDVAIRVLRNLEKREGNGEGENGPDEYILVARELSIVDMFNLANERVQGIATEGGGLTSHAAILARSMGIPTITNIPSLLERTSEGDFVILDATEGLLRVNPDEMVRKQYAHVGEEREEPASDDEVPEWAQEKTETRDGEEVTLNAACGNLPEVEQAAAYGMPAIGLYRTELFFLVEKDPPSRESLIRHYTSVVQKSNGGVCFRLLSVDSSLEIPYLHNKRETYPQFGRAGIRLLLAQESVLRRQLQAILIASRGVETRIAIPMVTDCGDLRRVKEILFEERIELRKSGQDFQEKIELGCVIETPAAMIGVRDLARESDFLTINLDSMVQYLLAADRESAELSHYFESLHPMVLRSLAKISEVCKDKRCSLSIFGVTASEPSNLGLLLGSGLRSFDVPPGSLRALMGELSRTDLQSASRATRAAARSSCQAETESLMQGFRHGFARS